ncbi:MAG: HEAT repeat domain-containing protein, partial [Thermoanaerobaculia bacterium]
MSAGREAMDRLASVPLQSSEERLTTVAELVRDPSPAVRGEALRVGAVVLPDEAVVELLRESADATLRNAGLEILKMRGGRGFALASKLLQDEDDDVVLQAVLGLDHLKDPRALEPLRRLLDHRDPNVVQAALTAVGHLGDARVVGDVLRFLEGDLWLQFAAVEALGDLRAREAVEPLAVLLTDVMVGAQAAEA